MSNAAVPDPLELMKSLEVTVEPGLLFQALTHRSYAYENGGLPTNERLEFLGDSVLGLVVTAASTVVTLNCPRANWPSCGPPW